MYEAQYRLACPLMGFTVPFSSHQIWEYGFQVRKLLHSTMTSITLFPGPLSKQSILYGIAKIDRHSYLTTQNQFKVERQFEEGQKRANSSLNSLVLRSASIRKPFHEKITCPRENRFKDRCPRENHKPPCATDPVYLSLDLHFQVVASTITVIMHLNP